MNSLSIEKQNLLKDLDCGKITKKLYNARMKIIEEKLIEERSEIIRKKAKELADIPVVIIEKKVYERRGPKVKEDSYISLIIKALMRPEVMCVNDAVFLVQQWKPGRDKEKLKTHIKRIIYNVKKKTGIRWERYEWDKKRIELIDKGEKK